MRTSNDPSGKGTVVMLADFITDMDSGYSYQIALNLEGTSDMALRSETEMEGFLASVGNLVHSALMAGAPPERARPERLN